MFYIDWYTWPLLAVLAIAEIGRGTRDLKHEFSSKKPSKPINLQMALGYIELFTGFILLIPTLTDRTELAFLAFSGSIIAFTSALIRFNPIQKRKPKFEAMQGIAFITLSISIIITSIF